MPCIGLFRSRLPADERRRLRDQISGETGVESLFHSIILPPSTMVLLGMDEPQELNLYREGQDFSPPYDVVVKADYPDMKSFEAAMAQSLVGEKFEMSGAFLVEETVKKRPATTHSIGLLEGVHMLHPLGFHSDLPRSALLRSWRDVHGDLAVGAHSGANYYSQLLTVANVVTTCEPYGGFSEFHFPSRQALFDGYFKSDEARQAVRHDIRHFINGIPPRLFATAYVVDQST